MNRNRFKSKLMCLNIIIKRDGVYVYRQEGQIKIEGDEVACTWT